MQTVPPAQLTKNRILQSDEPYLHPTGFDQEFLLKPADVKQIWDFTNIQQVQPDGFAPIKNALNDFQYVYRKTLYPLICLRGQAVIYALDDAMWAKYHISILIDQDRGNRIDYNPLYRRAKADEEAFISQDQDAGLEALVLRGSHIAVCHQALNGLSIRLAKQGSTAQPIFKELANHLVPGAQQTPSGSSLIAVAQHLGFTYAKQ